MVIQLTKKESALHKCAVMILHDQCPPEREHYLCTAGEDDTALDCILCWDNYLRGIAAGTIELPKAERRAGA